MWAALEHGEASSNQPTSNGRGIQRGRAQSVLWSARTFPLWMLPTFATCTLLSIERSWYPFLLHFSCCFQRPTTTKTFWTTSTTAYNATNNVEEKDPSWKPIPPLALSDVVHRGRSVIWCYNGDHHLWKHGKHLVRRRRSLLSSTSVCHNKLALIYVLECDSVLSDHEYTNSAPPRSLERVSLVRSKQNVQRYDGR